MAEYFAEPASAAAAAGAPSDVSEDVLQQGETLVDAAAMPVADPGLRQLSRAGADRHGAGHSRAARACAPTYVSAQLGALALRHAHGEIARLHAACRRPSHGSRCDCGRRLSCDAARARQPGAGAEGQLRRCRSRAAASPTEEAAVASYARSLALLRALAARGTRQRAGAGADCGTTTWSSAANISRAPATASPAIPRRKAASSPAGAPCRPRSARSTRPTSRPIAETGIGKWTRRRFLQDDAQRPFPDGGLIYPAMPFASYTKVTRADSDAIFAYLRSIPPVNAEEPAARSALSL